MDQDGPQNGTGVGDENDATLGLDEVVGTFEGVRPPAISGYRILDLLGKGGMGRVYLAEDLFLDRLVAIKVISDEIPRQEEPVAMFQREARAMAAIEHPNIVHIYAYGIEEDRPYFVMQYIEGQTLASRIGPGELWSMADAVRTGLNIVDALRAAWSQRIVHRDLKPANVLIDSEGIAHVADFGLAMAVQSSLEAGGMLTRRRFVGTPRYVAPEQAMGHDVDFRADFYSLGLMLYEMFVGETPFHGDTPHETMRLRFSENPPSVRERRPDLPIEIDRIVTWLTARDPDIRPSTHDSLFARLQELKTVRSGSDGRGFSFSEVRAQTSGAALSSAHVEQRTSFTSFAPRTTQPLKAESHFIGRGQEVDRLGLRILEVLNGKGSIVSVVGPAGIGKSRLLLELNRQYSDRDLTFLKGQASAMGNTLAFHPLTDILRDWTKISSHDSNAEAVQKLESAIETLGDPRIRETLPFITRLMGLKLTGEPAERVALIEGQNLRRLIFNSLRSLIVAASSIRPLVLVFEDLHWADQTSLELLESLYGLAMNHSILFISLFRPGFDNTSGSFSELLKSSYGPFYDEITLQPLSPSECEDLFNNMTGKSKFSITLRQSIVEKCDGNPYFLEELVRSILDRAMEQTERGELTDGGRLEDLEVPETVQEVLHARIDRLDEDSREVIRIAAVAGRTVPFRVVQEIAGTSRDLEDRFLFLEDLGIVRRTEQHGQLSYTFRHALMQDVVYGSINHESRQLLHIKVAQAIEKVFSEREHEFFGMLAYHYTAAKDPVKSEKYLVKAGRLAQQSAASSEALRFFRRALDLYSCRVESQTDPHVLANLKKQVALALFDHGSYRESIDAFREILPSFGVNPPRSDSQLIAAFITSFIDFIFAIHFSRFRFNRKPSPSDSEAIGLYYKQLAAMAHHDAKRFFLESFVLARRLGVFDLKAVDNGVAMYVSAGNLLSWTGASFYLSNRVLTLVEDKIDASKPNEHISFEAAKITHAFLAGKWVDSSYNEQLVDDALGIGEIFLSSNYVIFHGRTALELGRLEDANRFAEELSRISVEYDHSYPAALHFYLHAKTLLKKRQLPEAILECNSGRQAAEVAALDTVLFGLAALKARALAFMGDLDDANEILQDIESNFDFSRLPKSYRGDYLISRCTVDVFRLDRSVLLENRDQSRRELKSARGSTDRLIRNSKKVASHRVEAQRLTGIVDWLSGNQQTALRKWKRGIALGERLHANLDLSRLYCEIGKRLQSIEGGRRSSPGEKSEFYLDHARSMFTEIGLDWDLDEITDSCHVHISR